MLDECTLYSIPALSLLQRTYPDANSGKLVAGMSNQSAPSEDGVLRLDTPGTCVLLLASSDMYVATGQVLFDK
jgi:hypothetical protein